MNTKEYIRSGVIEAYVLGLASEEEAKQVEAYATQYAEVQDAITSFEKSLEAELLRNAATTPAFLKDKVMAAISNEKAQTPSASATSETVPPAAAPKQTAKVISLTHAPKGIRWLRGAVAASVILLLGSAILNFYYYNQYKKYSGQYKNLVAQQNTLIVKNEAYKANFSMVMDAAVVKVTLEAASEKRGGSVATVFWNKKTRDVYLTVNQLPRPAAGKQYQLWAIVNGTPVNAGMITNKLVDSVSDTIKMNPKISNAEAFAITLEKTGGSPTPTMEQLFVLGKVS